MTRTACIIGTGTIGPSLAVTFALHGFGTRLVGRRAAALPAAEAEMARAAGELEAAGLLPESAAGWQARIQAGTDLAAAVAGADIVVEAIAEDVEAKQALLAEIEPLLAEDAVIASGTSGLAVDEIGAHLRHPRRFLVAHFANPPHLMPAVEMVPGSATAPEIMDRACAIVAALGKEPVRLARDLPGHLFNRLQFALFREALALVRDGVATPGEIDKIVKHGYALRLALEGPFEKADLVGVPLMAAIARYLFPSLDTSTAPDLLDRLIAEGRLGAKAGRGVHDWRERDPAAVVAARNAEIIRHLQRLRGRPAP